MNTLEQIAQLLGKALLPFAEIFDRADDDIVNFVENLGYVLPFLPPSLQSLQARSRELVTSVTILNERINELEELEEETGEEADSDFDSQMLQALGEVVAQVSALLNVVSNLHESLSAELPPNYVATTNIASEFEGRLHDWVIWTLINDEAPFTRKLLTLFGVLESTDFAEDPAVFQPEYQLKRVRWERLPAYLDDPAAIFAEVYGWGTPNLDTKRLFDILVDISRYSLAPAEIGYPTESFMDAISPGSSSNAEIEPYLRWQIFNLGLLNVAAIVYATPKADPTEIPGLALTITADGDLSQAFPLTDQLLLELKASMNLALGLALVLRPGQALQVVNDVLSGGTGTPVPTGQAMLQLTYSNAGQTESGETGKIAFHIFSLPGGSYLDANSLYLKAGAGVLTGQNFDALLEAGIRQGIVSLNMSESDGFLKSILPGDGIKLTFDMALGWTRTSGIYFIGSAALEIQIPTHIAFGPINLDSLYVIAGIDGSQIPLEISSVISANLGPLSAIVERLGIKLTFDFPGQGGNLGPLDLSFGFKPPTGVGLAIDAGVVKGGGFLHFDPDKEEYDGLLELDLSGIVSVKAIGLITTRMPDGSKGFSLLLIITAEFGTPIQLGLGFTLSAVGGLLGLNRTMRLEVIATGIRDGGINSIMFPQNIIENAPRIISDLKKYFPVEPDTFLIGPMVKIGWGTPNLVTVSLGIIIEIPGNIAILGVLKVVLPDEEAPLIVIQVNFIGAIEFDKKRLWFFASIFESRILYITLEGEMGLLVGWGDDPNFVVSVGGFHPAFNPPPLPFGAIARIASCILNTDFARIRMQEYFAVTSNSVQFGAAVEIFFGVSAFNIDGHLGFDALFRFSPFYFIITISASLSVKVFGVGLFSVHFNGSLEGPTPWHVEGTGSISLLFFDIDVDFSHTWGNESETTLPPIAVLPLLVTEFQKLENWLAVLPASNKLLVSLRSVQPSTTALILHPVGSLKISQRAVPLDLTIDKVGNQKPSDANRFSVTVSTSGLDNKGDVEESFAIGQYLAKSDNELLSAKSFEPLKGGVELSVSGEQYHAPRAVKRVVRYEKIIIDTYFKRFAQKFFPWIGVLFNLFLNGNAVSLSAISYKQQKQLKPFADKVEIGKTLYAVAHNDDNTPFHEDAIGFTSQAQAQEFLKQQVAADANLARQLHVIPQVEMQRTA